MYVDTTKISDSLATVQKLKKGPITGTDLYREKALAELDPFICRFQERADAAEIRLLQAILERRESLEDKARRPGELLFVNAAAIELGVIDEVEVQEDLLQVVGKVA